MRRAKSSPRKRFANTRECLTALAQRFPGATIAMETGTHSPWVSRLFTALGHRVIVANARKLRKTGEVQALGFGVNNVSSNTPRLADVVAGALREPSPKT
jgi:transposase